ncbi:MAG: DsbA family protein [Pseudomonadota bacterium]|nr:DsbA family protein [Pseudomonadota bacterium]
MMIDRRRVLGRLLGFTGALGVLAAGFAVAPSFTAPAFAQSQEELLEPQALPDMVLGAEDAPVTIIEYASMTCPHCAAFHENSLPGLKEKYIDTGKVRLIFREFPFDPRAAAAFMLARCAPKDQYFPMIDVMFRQQNVWATARDPRPPLLQIAKLAGFTQESFEACLKNQQVLDNVMAVKDKAAKEYRVESTPTFFINGEKQSGAFSVEEMSKFIDKHL